MKHLLMGATAALSLAVSGPAWAQISPPGTPQAWPPATYAGPAQPCPFPGVAPRDAYRMGIINRWQLEQFEGPTPQALQGPSPDGGRGGSP